MSLKDVKVKVKDGGLGILAPAGTGLHAKVGVASRAMPNQLIVMSDYSEIPDVIGVGPLADALLDSFVAGSRMIYVVAAQADVTGTVGVVTSDATGTGQLSVTGSPLNAVDAIVQIVGGGGLNEATFKVSTDGGRTFGAIATVPQTGTYELGGTGLTLKFADDANEPPKSFVAGDVHRFAATAPQASVASVNAALDVLLDLPLTFDFVHVVGESDASMWAALDARAQEAFERFRYIHILAEACGPQASQTVDEWAMLLSDESKNFASTRVAVSAALGRVSDVAVGRVAMRNLAGLYAGRVCSIPVQKHPGEVALGSIPSIVSLGPDGINSGHVSMLDDARFITFRTYEGLPGFYVNEGRMMAAPTSDYQQVETRRVVDKASRLVRVAGLQHHKGPANPAGLDAFKASLQVPLRTMIADEEIMSGRVAIPPGQDILASGRLRAKVRITPVPIMREIEIELGLENPFSVTAEAPAQPAGGA